VTRVVITGYASFDHVMRLDGVPAPGATTRILHRPAEAWPRIGGSPAYVAAALVAGGVPDAVPLSWVGADAEGETYRATLDARGIRSDGVARVAGARTPMALLGYTPDGGCVCLYHASLPEPLAITPHQDMLLRGAAWVCVTVGPPAVTDRVLALAPPHLAWAVKHDAKALTRAQAQALAGRADLLCFSQAEAAFVAGLGARRPDCIVVETRGAAGAVVRWHHEETALPAIPLACDDPTGAGDTVVGGMLAALIGAPNDPAGALRAGMAAAADLLRRRGALS
jgi:ribokinase